MPKFADSGKELLDFLANTLKYPVFSRNHGRVGRVIMQFVVGEDGRISRIAVVKSSGTLELDQQALRVVRLMPVWKPGKNHNRPAEMYFTMPVTFTLD
jgi:protein TonB